MDLDLEELAAIIEQLDKTEFTDFSFEKGDFRLRVSRGGHFDSPAAPPFQAAPAPASGGRGAALTAVPHTATAEAADRLVHSPGHTIVTAPMLGTFYSAPKPGSPAFVAVGDVVEAEAVVCIVEVMKLMNSVQAGVSGRVVEVYAKDGDLVEFGQPLFAVRESA